MAEIQGIPLNFCHLHTLSVVSQTTGWGMLLYTILVSVFVPRPLHTIYHSLILSSFLCELYLFSITASQFILMSFNTSDSRSRVINQFCVMITLKKAHYKEHFRMCFLMSICFLREIIREILKANYPLNELVCHYITILGVVLTSVIYL